MKARKVGDFHFTFIQEVLMTLKANDMDYKKTAAAFDGVGERRIADWRAKFGDVLYTASPVVVKDADVGIKVKREMETEPLRKTATEVTGELLKQIMHKLRVGNPTLQQLTLTFKEVVPYILPKFEKDNKVGGTTVEATYEVFMNNIYNKLNGDVKQEKLTVKSTEKK